MSTSPPTLPAAEPSEGKIKVQIYLDVPCVRVDVASPTVL
jgi:hypothetical protein